MDDEFTNLTKTNTTTKTEDVVHNVGLDENIADRIFGL